MVRGQTQCSSPPFIPSLLPVKDEEEVFKLGKTEPIPLDLARVILLTREWSMAMLVGLTPDL
jgi:hypothetical protein